MLGISQSAFATTLLFDDFGDGTLGTNPGTGGGFTYLDNGQGAGSVTESGTVAQIQDGSNSSTVGMYSSNAFDLSNSSLSYSTTWEFSSWSLSPSAVQNRIFLSLQTNNDWLFAGGTEESRIILEIDALNDDAYLRYQNRSSNSNVNFDSSLFSFGSDLTGDADGFSVTLVIDSSGFTFTTTGLDATNQVNISDTWENLGTNFATVTGDGDFHVASYAQNANTTGLLSVDSVTLATIPEPKGILLCALGLLILLRRNRE